MSVQLVILIASPVGKVAAFASGERNDKEEANTDKEELFNAIEKICSDTDQQGSISAFGAGDEEIIIPANVVRSSIIQLVIMERSEALRIMGAPANS